MGSILSSSLLAICLAALFCSAAEGKDSVLRFMMIGDWGGQSSKPHYTDAEMKVSDQMGKTASDIGANFTVAVGDNFYDDGVKDVDDKRFKETFEVRWLTQLLGVRMSAAACICTSASRGLYIRVAGNA